MTPHRPSQVTSANPHLALALSTIYAAANDCQIPFLVDEIEENPLAFSCGTVANGHFNYGIICIDATTGLVTFHGHDDLRERRDVLEGIPEEESPCWWSTTEIDLFILFLMGEVREIQHQVYRRGPLE